MFTDAALTLADQLVRMVELFCATMAAEACKRRVAEISVPLWNRVRKLERRFAALYAMWKAGTLPKVRARRHTSPRGGARPAGVLPRGVRWMERLLPLSAGTLRCMLAPLLDNHPEARAFVAEVPQAGRVLRPLCRLVWLKVPDYLALPKRKRGSSPRPSPQGGERLSWVSSAI
ncbi:MAG TPA: hypothetical protein VGH36_04440 [Acetobacteraceae bacterium]